MVPKETIREMIACAGAEIASNIVRCAECPYGDECSNINAPTCALTLKECNANYIRELTKLQKENSMGIAEDMINTLNESQGENKMTTMLPDNTIQINPQGEIEGLDSLSLEDLRKLTTAAHSLLDRKEDDHEQQLWDNVVNAVKEYCEEYGNIVVLCDRVEDGLEFNCHQMGCRGEIDCE